MSATPPPKIVAGGPPVPGAIQTEHQDTIALREFKAKYSALESKIGQYRSVLDFYTRHVDDGVKAGLALKQL